uniref:Uncharacterized protein n=1 Tax=Vespula pensylvanica TaxID=30213 RepID=A0A834UG97_VESPE|nr:hypothetical protein H0235_000273 [Vespula pensylvanica]
MDEVEKKRRRSAKGGGGGGGGGGRGRGGGGGGGRGRGREEGGKHHRRGAFLEGGYDGSWRYAPRTVMLLGHHRTISEATSLPIPIVSD